MIEITALNKSFDKGRVRAIQQLELNFHKGELSGLIGPDGGGKTTLLKILNTTLRANSGTVKVAQMDLSKNIRKIRRMIGYVPEQFNLYPDLSVEENLLLCCRLYQVDSIMAKTHCHLLYEHLRPYYKRPAAQLSGGTRQKLALCCALLHAPEILLLDEPTRGLDYPTRMELWDILKEQREKGTTIVMATADMNEASHCDRITLFREGRAMDTGSPAAITSRFEGALYAIESKDPFALSAFLNTFIEVRSAYVFGSSVHVVIPEGNLKSVQSILALHDQYQNLTIRPHEVSLEDRYLQLMEHA